MFTFGGIIDVEDPSGDRLLRSEVRSQGAVTDDASVASDLIGPFRVLLVSGFKRTNPLDATVHRQFDLNEFEYEICLWSQPYDAQYSAKEGFKGPQAFAQSYRSANMQG